MGKVIKGAFGVGAAEAQSAGEPQPALPTPEALASQLDQALGYLRQATTRLTNLVPPGAANEEQLNALFDTHVTIQDNLADIASRLQADTGDQGNLGEGAYMSAAKDLVTVQQQLQSYIESVEKLIGESGTQSTQLAPTSAPRHQINWVLVGALALAAAGAGYGLWRWSKKKR